METKSRYEIIAELEEKKSKLITQASRVDLNENLLKRNIEKAQEELDEFLVRKDIEKANIKDQLESIEKSLNRLDSQKTK